jgi:hypothetical protein
MENNSIILEPSPKSFEFLTLTVETFLYHDIFCDDSEKLENKNITEDEFWNFVKNPIPKIRAFCHDL